MFNTKTPIAALVVILTVRVFSHPAMLPTSLDLDATTPNPALIPPTPTGTHSVGYFSNTAFAPAITTNSITRRDDSESSAWNSTLPASEATPSSSAAALEPRRLRHHHVKVDCNQICNPWAEFYNLRFCAFGGCHGKTDKVGFHRFSCQ
jgi:hypothetical protein